MSELQTFAEWRDDTRYWSLVTVTCPWCGASAHFHGGGDGPIPSYGHRSPHCITDAPQAGYVLVPAPGPHVIAPEHLRGPGVYVIGAHDGPRKIGVTTNLADRLSTLQTGNPAELLVLAWFPGATVATEAALHKAFAHRRVRGEWFDVMPGEVRARAAQIM